MTFGFSRLGDQKLELYTSLESMREGEDLDHEQGEVFHLIHIIACSKFD